MPPHRVCLRLNFVQQLAEKALIIPPEVNLLVPIQPHFSLYFLADVVGCRY